MIMETPIWLNAFTLIILYKQCDQIGLFLEDLGDNFPCNNSSKILKLFEPFEKCLYLNIL